MEKHDYWFYVLPDVYVAQNNAGGILLYETKTGMYIKTEDSYLINIVHKAYLPENLGVISISDKSLLHCKSIIDEAISKNLIGLLKKSSHISKPINFLPILNLQKDFDNTKEKENLVNDDIISYLSQLNIYLLSEPCNKDWDSIYQQVLSPIFSEYESKQLDSNILFKILSEASFSIMKDVNLLGGDLRLYRKWTKLNNVLHKLPQFKYHFWFRPEDLSDLSHPIFHSNTIYIYDIIIVPQQIKSLNTLKYQISELKKMNLHVILHIYVTSDAEYVLYNEEFRNLEIKIQPLYNTENTAFFEDNVFLSEEDILSSVTSMRNIFCNQKVNSNFFGILNIYPNGNVKTIHNAPVLGNIYNENLKSIILKELYLNTAWRCIRDNETCNFCYYRYICPPPSKYEFILNKNNLCKLK